nr:MAG: hypothetical protein [Wenzhou bat tapwovirus 1]
MSKFPIGSGAGGKRSGEDVPMEVAGPSPKLIGGPQAWILQESMQRPVYTDDIPTRVGYPGVSTRDLKGFALSPNKYAAAIILSFPSKELWRFCEGRTGCPTQDEMKNPIKMAVANVTLEPTEVSPLYNEESNAKVSLVLHWIAAVALTKDYVSGSLYEGTKSRVVAQLASRTNIKPILPVIPMDFSEYEIYTSWVAGLPKVAEYIGLCCLGRATFAGSFQKYIDQVRMVNLYGRFKMAYITYEMITSANITGIYHPSFEMEIEKFQREWSKVKDREDLPFLALLDPDAIRPLQGRDWNHLYTLARVWSENQYGSMRMMQGYNHKAVVDNQKEFLQPVTRSGKSGLISKQRAAELGLPEIKEMEEDSASKMERLFTFLQSRNPGPSM